MNYYRKDDNGNYKVKNIPKSKSLIREMNILFNIKPLILHGRDEFSIPVGKTLTVVRKAIESDYIRLYRRDGRTFAIAVQGNRVRVTTKNIGHGVNPDFKELGNYSFEEFHEKLKKEMKTFRKIDKELLTINTLIEAFTETEK